MKEERLERCRYCNEIMNLDEKTLRYNGNWFHAKCLSSAKIMDECKNKPRNDKSTKPSHLESEKKPSNKPDAIQVAIASTIFVFLVTSVYFILGVISSIAMALGSSLLLYHLFSAFKPLEESKKYGKKGLSVFVLFLLIAPFVMATMIAFEGYTIGESIVRILLLWALTVTFWSTMLFVPMAVYSKYREDLQPELTTYPSVSILIPAFDEEKVISHTIEALIETKYPKKEIILIDDGSTDNTLEIANQYKNKIKILSKKNGGKASALNYGLTYAKGEIVAIVDADTIVGRNSIKELVKGFSINKQVAAVAGNVKVRNRINWITNCQALEYITGIQVVRRAFDIFGAISIVPGALGAFKRSVLEDGGAYTKDTIVEDFDTTIKVLKSGLITQGSTKATAYTEAPSTLNDFVKQRKRWYRGNIQVLKRHSDALSNPRYGFLQKLAFPYLMLGMLVTPIIGFLAVGNAIVGIINGDGWYILGIFAIFAVVHYLMSALAIRIDRESHKLMWYSGFLVLGFKQLVDFLLLKAIIEQLFRQKAVWTSATRTGLKR